jgi:hypothetical protein
MALLGVALAVLAAFVTRRLIGEGGLIVPSLLLLAIAAPSLLLAKSLPEPAISGVLKCQAFFAAALAFAAIARPEPETLSTIFGMAAICGAAVCARTLARANAARRALGVSTLVIFGLGAVGAIHALYYVAQSQDFMIYDFMRNRLMSYSVAQKIDTGQFPLLFALVAASLKEDYSWLPALPTGAAMAVGAPLSRTLYQTAVALFYVGPALFALGVLTRDLLLRAGERGAALKTGLCAAFAGLAAFLVYPTGVVVASRGMPDIFGLVFVVLALRHGEKLWRALALGARHDALITPLARRLTLALCLDLFAMVMFRRWYAFVDAGLLSILALGVASRALTSANFAWSRALQSASLGLLACLALFSPILADWLSNLQAHQYVDAYAPYRKAPVVDLMRALEWVGIAPFALALAGAVVLWRTSANRRLLILTLGSAIIAAGLFLRIQSPAAHHYYLIAPALAALAAAPLVLAFARRRVLGLALMGCWGVLALEPALVDASLPFVFALAAPHAPRSDLKELMRMRTFVAARTRPGDVVCGLGSSYTFSNQLIDELWQLAPEQPPLPPPGTPRLVVSMFDVDTVDGAPNPDMKNCGVMIAASPIQTHLVPDDQMTVILPTREVLTGQGIGTHYQRTGEVFHLENNVQAIVFERKTPLTDDDMQALDARWREARQQGPLQLRGDIDESNISKSP